MQAHLLGNPDSNTILIQMVDDHDLEVIDSEFRLIKEATSEDFALLAAKVGDWNHDLSPWEAAPVFGNVPFGDGASDTLARLIDEIIPEYCCKNSRLYIGGYSLSGLFALWAAYNCNLFKGVAAVSPSAWFPGFVEYAETNRVHTESVYLSLGDKEEKTRNPVMATVGSSIRQLHARYAGAGIPCVLEWNEGNHFHEPDVRTAKGFSWLLNHKS